MKPFIRNTIILFGLIVIDQALKLWVESARNIADLGIVAFHYVSNTGASFGMLQGNNVLLAWISVVILGLIMVNADKIKKDQVFPFILIVSGLLGNLIDRVFRGHVIDFIDFKFWPVFNLADSLIVVGVVWLIVVILREDYKDSKKKDKRKNKNKAKNKK